MKDIGTLLSLCLIDEVKNEQSTNPNETIIKSRETWKPNFTWHIKAVWCKIILQTKRVQTCGSTLKPTIPVTRVWLFR
jgi:hypothetical protein